MPHELDIDVLQPIARAAVSRAVGQYKPLLLAGLGVTIEDVQQDCLLHLIENIGKYTQKPGARFTTWAFRVIYNKARVILASAVSRTKRISCVVTDGLENTETAHPDIECDPSYRPDFMTEVRLIEARLDNEAFGRTRDVLVYFTTQDTKRELHVCDKTVYNHKRRIRRLITTE